MKSLLIKVEDVFEIRGRGLILTPFIPIENELPKSAAVLLIRPDGSELEAQADFEVPFYRFINVEDYAKRRPAYEIVLRGAAKAEVPVGTQVWLK